MCDFSVAQFFLAFFRRPASKATLRRVSDPTGPVKRRRCFMSSETGCKTGRMYRISIKRLSRHNHLVGSPDAFLSVDRFNNILVLFQDDLALHFHRL